MLSASFKLSLNEIYRLNQKVGLICEDKQEPRFLVVGPPPLSRRMEEPDSVVSVPASGCSPIDRARLPGFRVVQTHNLVHDGTSFLALNAMKIIGFLGFHHTIQTLVRAVGAQAP